MNPVTHVSFIALTFFGTPPEPCGRWVLRQISQNAGFEGSVVVNRVIAEKGAFGFNAQTNVYEDLMKAGVIDPTKVTRTALENAASIAGLLLTTEAVVTDQPEDKKSMPEMPGGMGGMY